MFQFQSPASAARDIVYVSEPVVQEVPPSPAPAPTRTRIDGATLPPSVDAVLRSGVLIVISTTSQQMYVFRNGELWDDAPVSTGKQGKETPPGVFPVLQKRVFHRSNLYSNAPMPHMQRLTWDGIAIHAGRLPGYPASHGCIRLPPDFARALFKLTRPETTTVVVTNQPVVSARLARLAARNMPRPLPGERGHLVQPPEPRLAALYEAAQEQARLASATETAPTATPTAAANTRPGQTIQLVAAQSEGEAEAYWRNVSARHPELEKFDKAIIPAIVNAQQYYRLRVTGPGARDMCSALQRAGTECFPVG